MMSSLPDDWTDEDQDDLDRGKSSWDDDQWSDTATRRRSLWKAVSWEIVSSVVSLGLAYVCFGSIGNCLVFTGVTLLIKLVMFYYHERIWENL